MNEQITDFSFYCIFRKCPNFYGNGVFIYIIVFILSVQPKTVFCISEPPANVRISEIKKSSISLTWQKPPYDGGSKITGYTVERRDAPKGRWTKANFTNVIDTNFTVSGLNQGESYEFRVFAKNTVGSISNPSLIAGPATCIDTQGKLSIYVKNCGKGCFTVCYYFNYNKTMHFPGAPEIDVPPEYLDIVTYKAGAAFKISVGIIAKPLPTIEWFKDGNKLKSSSNQSVESTSDTSGVLIKDATRLNTGTYEIKIKNAFGSASASIRVQILGMYFMSESTEIACNKFVNEVRHLSIIAYIKNIAEQCFMATATYPQIVAIK